MTSCWQTDPNERPSFDDIFEHLDNMLTDQNVSKNEKKKNNRQKGLLHTNRYLVYMLMNEQVILRLKHEYVDKNGLFDHHYITFQN